MERNSVFDVVVIGSGVGGLATATLLTRAAGLRVLVVEKHYEIGGFTHAFRRRGYSFDTGLHYVGQMASNELPRRISDTMTGGKLSWKRMPHEYDIFSFPEYEFAVPEGEAEYRTKLTEAFPHEADAIRAYFRDLKRAARWQRRDAAARFMPRPLSWLMQFVRLFGARLGLMKTERYFTERFSDSRLAALLLSQWGDYGMPPDESAFGVHALIVSHYLDGAFYPAGGPERIARYAEEVIESGGGRIVTQAEAAAIETRDDRATGVLVRHLDSERRILYEAKHVVSSIGAPQTLDMIDPATGNLRAASAARSELDEQDAGYSCVILFLGLASGPESFGSSGANYWLHTADEQPSMAELSASVIAGSPRNAYLSFPAAKTGDDRPHTAEIIAFVDPAAFDRWRGSDWQERGRDYESLKRRITEGLIDLADCRLPGLRAAIAYQELATPLSITHFTSRPAGRMYGLEATPRRYSSTAAQARTPIAGLYLSGSDVVSVGIVGAMMGGLGAALHIAGLTTVFPALYKSRPTSPIAKRSAPAESERVSIEPLSGDRRQASLVKRSPLGNDVYELVLNGPAGQRVTPGQFARLEVAPYEWRDYSIAAYDADTSRITLVIDAQFSGAGGTFAREAPIGTRVSLRMPVGSFVFRRSPRPAVFVATGTGITPFVPMYDSGTAARLFFGCRTTAHDLTARYVPNNIDIRVCVSREQISDGEPADRPNVRYRPGHVTEAILDAIDRGEFVPEETDFYICGNPDMVMEVHAILAERGARYVYQEAY